jgi:hypothetical protein
LSGLRDSGRMSETNARLQKNSQPNSPPPGKVERIDTAAAAPQSARQMPFACNETKPIG